jgi:membrane-associated phospholipid phosphatase
MKRKDFPLWAKIICYVVSGIVYGLGIYLCGKDMPSVNGYNDSNLKIPSFCIAAFALAIAFAGGFFVCRKGNETKLWPLAIIMIVIFTVALLPAGYLIKLVIHRPRYRLVEANLDISFRNWWDSFKEYKDYIAAHPGVTKEEFKSFPSGHSGTGMILAMFFPMMVYFFPKLKKYQVALFYTGVAWGLVMMFSRMLCGAHYLTDTCMGSLIVMVVYYAVNEFAIRKGLYDEPKQEEPVPAVE